jgi:drug/metabolite transporter (DMT)-like permease
MLGALILVWGIAFVGIKEVLDELSPTALTILRFAIADTCLLVIMALVPAARPRFSRQDLPRLITLGICGVPGYHLALNWGEHRTSASIASLIVATAPVMVAIGSASVLRERTSPRRWVGIALAFSGVAVLAVAEPSGGNSTSLSGVLVSLIAPVSWAVYTIVAKPLTERGSAVQVTAASMLIGSAFLLPFVRLPDLRDIGGLSAGGWGWVLQLGIGSSVAGYFVFVWALGKLDATKVSVFLYGVPVVALISAAILLGEELRPTVVGAAALVIAGVVLVQQERLPGRLGMGRSSPREVAEHPVP